MPPHNPEVAGSSPVPAKTKRSLERETSLFLMSFRCIFPKLRRIEGKVILAVFLHLIQGQVSLVIEDFVGGILLFYGAANSSSLEI